MDNRQRELLGLLGSEPRSTSELAVKMNLTRQAVHLHLGRLADMQYVHRVGSGPATRWVRTVGAVSRWPLNRNADEDVIWRAFRAASDEQLRPATSGAFDSLQFAFTEMVNNAIDHSQGKALEITVTSRSTDLIVEVVDDGIGVFASVREFFGLTTERDAVAHLSKGRQTTASEAHSGYGIFFTSRLVEEFIIESHDLVWWVDNRRDDQTVASRSHLNGSRIAMTFDLKSTRQPKDVFDRFTNEDTLAFDRTVYHVKLSQHGEAFVSRSEAKRIAVQLELFGEVIIDFAGVRTVGQGFVDELFRVWTNRNPGTRLLPINMNEDVEFMWRKGLGPR